MTLLDVRGFTKFFQIHHLDRQVGTFADVSFTLDEGQFMLVSGPNGAGKSTLLRCLYRTYVPTGGQAIYHARAGAIDLATAADSDIMILRRDEIGFVTQFLRPRPRVSALELVAEPLLLMGQDAAAAIAEAERWLDHFGVKPDLWQAYPTTFSGGEQQKINLARALIAPRRLLLLDEPTASLDVAARAALTARLAELKAAGVTLIGIFHHPEEIRALVDVELKLSVIQGEIDHVADQPAPDPA
ncbi:MAG: phosphonate C-P lyase system protein PhnL [Candidatus Flexifilum sp.]|jgi:alpha-D-ribose 1-methylphosphonate 5-triphosphate synthase subunit PhnL